MAVAVERAYASDLDSPCEWAVATTHDGSETPLQTLFREAGIPSYTPMHRYWSEQRRGRAKPRRFLSWRALFPGYCGFGDSDHARYILSGRSAAKLVIEPRILYVSEQVNFLHSMRSVEAALRENPELTAAKPMAVGTHCRVTRGPFFGSVCMVEKLCPARKKREIQTAIVVINTMGHVEAEIPRDALEVIDKTEYEDASR